MNVIIIWQNGPSKPGAFNTGRKWNKRAIMSYAIKVYKKSYFK